MAHISDLHIGSSPERSFVLRRMCDAILASNIQTVIVTGDITNRGSIAEFEEFFAITTQLRADRNMILLPGNHDRSRANVSRQMMGDEPVNLVRQGDIITLRIDTTRWYNRITFASHGNISSAMLRDVDRLLSQVPKGTFVIVALHHHPLPLPAELFIEYISSWFSLPFAENLSYGSKLLEKIKGRCDLVLHGHRHVPSEIVFPYTQRPLAMYNAGSSTDLRAFRRFDIDGGRLIAEPTWISV
ncbi:MAG: metallophosphoesterase [Patescibacteria group bacterium]